MTFDPQTDLRLERRIAARPASVWRCWTEPDLLMQWFCPVPWAVTHAEIDLRPGGRFITRMEGPDGAGGTTRVESEGCFLDVEEGRRLAFTDALARDWRPNATGFMTAVITVAPDGAGGTLYTAVAMHTDTAARRRHEEMGFHDGWGAAAGQLEALAARL